MKNFNLSEEFVEQYKTQTVKWGYGDLGYFVFKRTYARPIYDENDNIIRTEEWWEVVKRVVEGCFSYQKQHCSQLGIPFDYQKSQRSAKKMYDKIFNFKFLPPGRGLWMAGTDFVEKHGSMSLSNCGFVSTERIDLKNTAPFEWAMNSLMLGTGVGSDIRGKGKIEIKQPKDINPWTKEQTTFIIPDSREGWVEALRWKLKAYFDGKPMPIFDYSQIRESGQPIRGFGGVSSGYKPLKDMLDYIDIILKPLIGQKITSAAIVDIINVIARCVVSGNLRRSACILLGNDGDEEFLNLKNPQLYPDELLHHRWASNNSILANVGKTDYSQYIAGIVNNGEPGFVWIENCRNYGRLAEGFQKDVDELVMGMNPCAEIPLPSNAVCTLVSVFPTNHNSSEEFIDTLKYAYLYAKSITLINTESPETNQAILRDRRVGVSVGGIVDAFVKFGRRNFLENWLDKGYHRLKQLDKTYSNWLCIPRSIKMTTVKPDGTLGLLAGVSPGIHYPHSKYYIRRVRISDNSEYADILRDSGYYIEQDKYSPNTLVVEFPVKIENYDRSKFDVTLWEQLQNTADLQHYWADNAVSVTITFKDSEIKDLTRALECYEDKLKSVSFLKIDTTNYEQMPYEEIDENKYNDMVSKITPLNLESSKSKGVGEKFCTNDSCSL